MPYKHVLEIVHKKVYATLNVKLETNGFHLLGSKRYLHTRKPLLQYFYAPEKSAVIITMDRYLRVKDRYLRVKDRWD